MLSKKRKRIKLNPNNYTTILKIWNEVGFNKSSEERNAGITA